MEIRNDVLYINEKEYGEPYLKENKEEALYNQNLTENLNVIVPKGSIFVLGDNRLHSGDSRIYGFVTKKSIVGEVKFRHYPFQDIGIPN
ncbi:signal peptidase I [Peribacillus deserti]|uniref:Signal peptidase I n=1 Tax=Peribacillus deserti TaxID=673318 RepID=A0ABS2QE37_9BACI|nr:signal peptidase I [Peribacillus deserti]